MIKIKIRIKTRDTRYPTPDTRHPNIIPFSDLQSHQKGLGDIQDDVKGYILAEMRTGMFDLLLDALVAERPQQGMPLRCYGPDRMRLVRGPGLPFQQVVFDQQCHMLIHGFGRMCGRRRDLRGIRIALATRDMIKYMPDQFGIVFHLDSFQPDFPLNKRILH